MILFFFRKPFSHTTIKITKNFTLNIKPIQLTNPILIKPVTLNMVEFFKYDTNGSHLKNIIFT